MQAVIGAALALTVVAGCSTKGAGAGGEKTGSDGVKTDYGVTKDKIVLGDLTDHSAAFKISGLSLAHGYEVWVDEVNKAGGICGRQIAIDSRDMGYVTEKAVSLYAGMKDDVLGMINLLGSPMIAALKSSLVTDQMVFVPDSWASSNLDTELAMMIGGSYDIEIINGLSYLQSAGKISDGDKIGHIYVDSEYGQNGLVGSKFYAEKHGMKIIEAKLTGSDVDLAPTITKMKSEGVKALLLSTTPTQSGAAATQSQNQGLDVPLHGNNPSFDSTLLDTPAAGALISQFTMSNYAVPFSDPAMAKVAKAYVANTTDPPNKTAAYGYSSGLVWQQILETACADKDLTRPNIVKKANALKEIDTGGITSKLDFSLKGQPSSRASFILKPDKGNAGGLATVKPDFASAEAKAYKTPFQ
ncbi:MAG: ABC transporter substrate-binding protein [Antricoccus sp.]